MTRVVMVCQWYAPEPVTQPIWIAEGVREQGLDVQVLTGVPNYPTGALHAGYSAWRTRDDDVDGLSVRRTPLYPSHDLKVAARIANYLSWAVSSALWGQRLLRQADVALVYSSPATAALAAWVANRLHGLPYVLHVQDLWPDSVMASGMARGPAARLIEAVLTRMNDVFYRRAARVVIISPGMRRVLVDRGVPDDRIEDVYNWVPDSVLAPRSPVEPPDGPDLRRTHGIADSDFVLMYAGNHGPAQSLEHVVRAVCSLDGTSARRVHLVLVGDGIDKAALQETAHELRARSVHFLDPVPFEQVHLLASQADAQLVSLASDPLFTMTMPSKLQTILAAAQPVLVCGEGDVVRVVEASGAGESCPPGDPDALARAIGRLALLGDEELRSMGARGRSYFDEHMAAAVGAARLAEVLRSTSRARGGSGRRIRPRKVHHR